MYNLQYFRDETEITQAGHRSMMNIHRIVGIGRGCDSSEWCPPITMDPRSVRHHIVYKRAGITEKDYPDQQDPSWQKQASKLSLKQRAAGENFKLTTFDEIEK
jgi:hypothetical protein